MRRPRRYLARHVRPSVCEEDADEVRRADIATASRDFGAPRASSGQL